MIRIVLLIILIIVLALIIRGAVAGVVHDPVLGGHEADEEAYWNAQVPLSHPPEDYLNAVFAYRYYDAFVYNPSGSTTSEYIYKVYPLSGPESRRSAYNELMKARMAIKNVGFMNAPIQGIERYLEPPRNQGQTSMDAVIPAFRYLVMKVERLKLFPFVSGLTCEHLSHLLDCVYYMATTHGSKLRDLSIANVGMRSNNTLRIQHLDSMIELEAPKKLKDKSASVNLLNIPYNILIGIPKTMFATNRDYEKYRSFAFAIVSDRNHYHNYAKYKVMMERM